MSLITNKTLDEFTNEIEGFFPDNKVLFFNGVLNEDTRPVFRKFIKYILAKPLLEISEVFSDLFDGLLLKNTLLIELFEEEVALPDSLFANQSTPEIRLINIKLKLAMKTLYGADIENGNGVIGIIQYIKEATGIILEHKNIKPIYSPFAPLWAPLWARGTAENTLWTSYWKVVYYDNTKYTLDFIKKLLLKIVPVYIDVILVD